MIPCAHLPLYVNTVFWFPDSLKGAENTLPHMHINHSIPSYVFTHTHVNTSHRGRYTGLHTHSPSVHVQACSHMHTHATELHVCAGTWMQTPTHTSVHNLFPKVSLSHCISWSPLGPQTPESQPILFLCTPPSPSPKLSLKAYPEPTQPPDCSLHPLHTATRVVFNTVSQILLPFCL